MKRAVSEQLLAWKNRARRKPLILRGARQVRKTWSVLDFGRRHFDGTVHLVDLEKRPDSALGNSGLPNDTSVPNGMLAMNAMAMALG